MDVYARTSIQHRVRVVKHSKGEFFLKKGPLSDLFSPVLDQHLDLVVNKFSRDEVPVVINLTSVEGFNKIQLLIQGREKHRGAGPGSKVDIVENNKNMGASGLARKSG